VAIVCVVGVVIPVAGSLVTTQFAPDWRLEAVPLHSVVEAGGGLIALSVAVLLRARLRLGGERHPEIWIGAALAGMGTLDVFHALVSPGQSFVGLHSLATLVGGAFFAGAWAPSEVVGRGRLDSLPLLAGTGALGLAVLMLAVPWVVPSMVVDGEFTLFARLLNLVGGLGFIAAAYRFLREYRASASWDDLLFAVHCSLFGAAGMLFELSRLWDGPWWWWHVLRLTAYVVALLFVALNFRSSQEQVLDLNRLLDEANRSLEDHVAERTAELETANERLEEEVAERSRLERQRWEARLQHSQKLESLGVLAGGIAHDFNNLLVGMLGNASLAQMHLEEGHPAQRQLGRIEKASRRAADLTRQLLAYSGKGRFVVRPLDLSKAIREMMELLESSISKKAVLRPALADGLPPVEVDVTQLNQVIMNLITNASDALGGKAGTIDLATGVLEADSDYLEHADFGQDLSEGTYVFLEITDSGSGMDEATKLKMFDPFFTTKSTGRGLGLAAALGIVRGHGGGIRVYSEEGRGTAIKVLLPSTPSGEVASEPEISGRGPIVPGGTVLVADDEAIVREVAQDALVLAGFEVLLAVDGPSCIARFTEAIDDIDLVLLDLMMPGLSGEEVFRELRRLRPEVRVLLSSGYNEQETSSRFLGRDLSGFLQKPYASKDLVKQVRELLSREP